MATQISAFFLFLLLPSPVLVHGQSYSSQSSDQSNLYKANFSSTVAVIIVVMISAFFSMVFFSLYLRRCAEPQAVDNRTHPSAGSRTRRKGLDKAVVDSFPMMVYSEVKELKYGKGTLECAVCLCEFDDAETLRLLPKCNHAFHPDCIGMWLESHATCPVCRADLASGEASSEDPPAHVEITVEGEGQEEEEEAGDVGRRAWSEEERERFTLRLPEGVREEVMARRLDRSATMAVTGRGLTKGGRGGWSFKKEWAAKSDRWAILGRTLSLRTPRESRRGEGSGVCRDEGESSSAATGGKDRKV